MDSVFFPICVGMLVLWFLWVKLPQIEADNYRKKHKIDYSKMNRDSVMNDLPEWMIDYNTKLGMYDVKERDNIKID